MAGENEGLDTGVTELPSVGDSLSAALERVESGEGAQSAPREPAEKTETAPQGERDPSGRFAKRTADVPGQQRPPAPAAALTAAPVAPAAPAAAPAEADAPPTSWSNEEKAEWNRLPPTAKAAIQRREREVVQGLQRAAESRKFGDSVYQEIAPYMEILRAEGATPQAAVKVLLETAHTLRHGSPENKRALMLSLIQQYGIDLSRPVDPTRAQLEQELDSRRHADFRRTADANTRIEREAISEVETFAQQPGHEHLDTVRPHMIALLNTGTVSTLQEAYDQAVWANPTTRAAVQMQENMQRSQSLQRNRAAASSVTGNPGGVTIAPTADPKNLRATLEQSFGGDRF